MGASLEYRIVKYYSDINIRSLATEIEKIKLPEPSPPPELVLSRNLGESRMIVAGGLYDQPAGLWQAQRRAGYLAYLLETQAKPDFDLEKTPLDRDDLETLDKLNQLRKQILSIKK